MDRDRAKVLVKDIADKIKEKVKGGMLYGWPIDLNDPDAVLVAVYFMRERELAQAMSGRMLDPYFEKEGA
jgi:hypothetical protein